MLPRHVLLTIILAITATNAANAADVERPVTPVAAAVPCGDFSPASTIGCSAAQPKPAPMDIVVLAASPETVHQKTPDSHQPDDSEVSSGTEDARSTEADAVSDDADVASEKAAVQSDDSDEDNEILIASIRKLDIESIEMSVREREILTLLQVELETFLKKIATLTERRYERLTEEEYCIFQELDVFCKSITNFLATFPHTKFANIIRKCVLLDESIRCLQIWRSSNAEIFLGEGITSSSNHISTYFAPISALINCAKSPSMSKLSVAQIMVMVNARRLDGCGSISVKEIRAKHNNRKAMEHEDQLSTMIRRYEQDARKEMIDGLLAEARNRIEADVDDTLLVTRTGRTQST